jgi:hypothetical protein
MCPDDGYPEVAVGELTAALDKKRRIDTAHQVYLDLYQVITGAEERQNISVKSPRAFLTSSWWMSAIVAAPLTILPGTRFWSIILSQLELALRPQPKKPNRAPTSTISASPSISVR